jgi:ferredoxin
MPVLDARPRVSLANVSSARRGARLRHHLGGGAGPRRGDLDRQVPARQDIGSAPPRRHPSSREDGIHEWSYDNDITPDLRHKVPWRDVTNRQQHQVEVELGFDAAAASRKRSAASTAMCNRLHDSQCIECDACVDICPTDCITFTVNSDESELRTRLRAPARHGDQALYVSDTLKTGRVMVKDEDVCLHCGLCAERCPTGAWDMQKFSIMQTRAGSGCRSAKPKKAVALT